MLQVSHNCDVYEFEDLKTCWLSIDPQGSTKWHNLHLGRLTAHNFGYAAGHDSLKTPEMVLQQIVGSYTEKPDTLGVERIARGHKYEPMIRKYFSRRVGRPINEIGIAIYKENQYLGASTDGDIETDTPTFQLMDTNGYAGECIEAKCPDKIYTPLMYRARVNEIRTMSTFPHILRSHYDQMIGTMAILGKSHCHYLVYSHSQKLLYREIVPFNTEYWNNDLRPKLEYFIDHLLKPKLLDIKIDTVLIEQG